MRALPQIPARRALEDAACDELLAALAVPEHRFDAIGRFAH
jgi:hypothetical protein